jgi:hypothetical protein
LTEADNLLAVYVYLAFRSNRPEVATMKDVLKDLQENNIDVSQLVDWATDHCQQGESSAEWGSPAQRNWSRK